ncbi:MAG: Mu transposase C-terminal domain-containing protein [Anaerolineae bacterium]|nr:Mu transposase C-terminal domain-containing protein [Anaerolineae bacterium]
MLLPEYDATISTKGEVVFEGLHFTDPLLKYWPKHQVTLRRSLHTEGTAWIYLDGEILCEAKAKGFRKRETLY